MVGLTDNRNLSEGLFLKNYLGTVTTASRPRMVEKKPAYAYEEYLHQKYNHSLKNGMLHHARIIYDLGLKNESGIESIMYQKSDTIQRNMGNHVELDNIIQVEIEDEKGKKKEKKWTLGGFFRRKNKKDADESSEESEEDKKGFLSRRKFKRSRRKIKSRNSTNGFDVIIPQSKISDKTGEISIEQLWSGDLKHTEPISGPVRYINRHPELCTKLNSALQIPKNYQKDLNLSRSAGGSENTEGKKNRKEFMARVEAKRDMLQDDSSSDECESYRSSTSLNRLSGDCRKPRRMDKHRRLSKSEDLQNDSRGVKSDFEGAHRLPVNRRWISKANCPDWRDQEFAKLNLMNHSGTPSPCRSPRTRQKQLLHYKMIPNSYPTSTFPPGVHYQHSRNGSFDVSSTHNNYTKENQFLVNDENQTHIINCDFEYPFSKSLNSSDNSNQKKLMEYEQFKNSYGPAKEKSLSCDQNIHRTSCFKEEFEEKINQQTDFKKVIRSDVFTNNGKRADIYDHEPQMAVSNYNAVVENRTYSTPSLQSGIFPQKPTHIVRKSASGNSFCENARNFHPDRSNSYQNIPLVHGYCSQENSQLKSCNTSINWNLSSMSHNSESMSQKSYLDGTPSVLRYYADQNPRSRNPIHITCNSTISEQPYLSDSQMIVKSVQSVRNSASDFWKIKDKELMKQQKKWESSLKPPPTQNNLGLNRSRSNSPKLKAVMKAIPKSSENAVNEFKSNSVGSNQLRKISPEEYSSAKISKNPPEPPVRRLSKQEVLARLQKCEQLKKQENKFNKNLQNEGKIHSYILDEALNELEAIYNSLSLKDEDLVEWSEKKDFPVFRPKSPTLSVSVRDKIQNFLPEINYSKNSKLTIPVEHQQALPLRRSGIPDKTSDDMAFRRLNQRGRTDVKKLPSQSYLRTSPALYLVQNVTSTVRKESPILEPHITYDDVVFRNIRHANSTLKIQDPQPPFGIPIGTITSASSSDYLHAMPAERFRPTFISSKTPDVVKDDLAFRNLRKDNKTNTCLEPNKNEIKKRAVRSLSANLYSIMQKENPDFKSMEADNVDVFVKNREKTQSLTDLTNGKNLLEKRMKELKDEKNAKRAEFFELSQNAGKKDTVSWTVLGNLNENFDIIPITELQKIDFPLRPKDNWEKFKSPVVELSKFPAAIPSSSLQGNPFKDLSFFDDDQLESLLSTLAKEAENASKDLERQLNWLETKKVTDIDEKLKAIEEFNRKFRSLNKTKRKRNLSLSNTNDFKEEVLKTGSLERRKKTNKNEFLFPEILDSKINEIKFLGKVAEKNEVGKFSLETNLSKSNSLSYLGCRERGRSPNFEVVTDLNDILKDVEVEQHLNNEITQKETNSVFQEVYEYNCKLPSPNNRGIRGSVENVETSKEISRIHVETEFEKLHEEVNSTKETSFVPNHSSPSQIRFPSIRSFTQVNDLMADITSVDHSPGDSYSSFPFPNDSETPFSMLNDRDGTSPRSSKGEGETKKPSLDNNVWLACSYALAFAFHLQEIDFLTALGIVLAVISVVAILIL